MCSFICFRLFIKTYLFKDVSFFNLILDINRTFPDNIHFSNNQADLRPALHNVLVAYAKHNPRIGYCQVSVSMLFCEQDFPD